MICRPQKRLKLMEVWCDPQTGPSNSTHCSRSWFLFVFMWPGKRISREELNIFSLNHQHLAFSCIKGESRQGLMLHGHCQQPSCRVKVLLTWAEDAGAGSWSRRSSAPKSLCARGAWQQVGCLGGELGWLQGWLWGRHLQGLKGIMLQEASGQRGWAHRSPGLCSAIELPAVLFHCEESRIKTSFGCLSSSV